MSLPNSIKELEQNKFVETSTGETAIRLKLSPDSYTVLDAKYGQFEYWEQDNIHNTNNGVVKLENEVFVNKLTATNDTNVREDYEEYTTSGSNTHATCTDGTYVYGFDLNDGYYWKYDSVNKSIVTGQLNIVTGIGQAVYDSANDLIYCSSGVGVLSIVPSTMVATLVVSDVTVSSYGSIALGDGFVCVAMYGGASLNFYSISDWSLLASVGLSGAPHWVGIKNFYAYVTTVGGDVFKVNTKFYTLIATHTLDSILTDDHAFVDNYLYIANENTTKDVYYRLNLDNFSAEADEVIIDFGQYGAFTHPNGEDVYFGSAESSAICVVNNATGDKTYYYLGDDYSRPPNEIVFCNSKIITTAWGGNYIRVYTTLPTYTTTTPVVDFTNATVTLGETTIVDDLTVQDVAEFNNVVTFNIPESEGFIVNDISGMGNMFTIDADSDVINAYASVNLLAGANSSGDIDFNTYKAIAMTCDNGATLPTSPTPVKGQWFLHTPTGRDILMMYNGTVWVPIYNFGTMTLYVDTTNGTDNQNKGTGTTTNAFKTIQYAVDQIPPTNAGNVTINVAAGTYSEAVVVGGKNFTGAYSITFQGALFATQTPTVNATCDTWTRGVATASGPTPAVLTDTGAFAGLTLKGYFWTKDDTTFYPIIDNDNDTITIVDNTITTCTTYKVYAPPTSVVSNSGNTVPFTVNYGQINITVNNMAFSNSGSGVTVQSYDYTYWAMMNCHIVTGTNANGCQFGGGFLQFLRSYEYHAGVNGASTFGMTITRGQKMTQNFSGMRLGQYGSQCVRHNQLSISSGNLACYYSETVGNGTGLVLLTGSTTLFGQWFKNFGTGVDVDSGGSLTYQNTAWATFVSCTNTVKKTYVSWNTDSKFGDGGTSNYTNWDSTGHQTMFGTAQPWNDVRVEPAARTTGSKSPSFISFIGGCGLYNFDNAAAGSEKEVYFNLQMPHDWNGSNIHLHTHWIGASSVSPSSNVRWGLEYTWASPLSVFTSTSTIYASVAEGSALDIVSNKHMITEFTPLVPNASQNGLSSILMGRLFRDSANAADSYSYNVGLLYIDAHYQMNSLGSTDEYTK